MTTNLNRRSTNSTCLRPINHPLYFSSWPAFFLSSFSSLRTAFSSPLFFFSLEKLCKLFRNFLCMPLKKFTNFLSFSRSNYSTFLRWPNAMLIRVFSFLFVHTYKVNSGCVDIKWSMFLNFVIEHAAEFPFLRQILKFFLKICPFPKA